VREDSKKKKRQDNYLTSKQVSPLSPIFLNLSTAHVAVFHLHTKACRGAAFLVRERAGTVLLIVYRMSGFSGWYLG
jgi:hypothetical protein